MSEKHVMVIDDDPDICEIIKAMVESDEVVVYSYYNVQDALSAVPKINPELCFVDLTFGGKKDGFMLVTALKKIAQNEIAVIVISGDDSLESIQSAMELGADDYLTKPFNCKYLKQRADAMLNSVSDLNDELVAVPKNKSKNELFFNVEVRGIAANGLMLKSDNMISVGQVVAIENDFFESIFGTSCINIIVLKNWPDADGGYHIFARFRNVSNSERAKLVALIDQQ